MTTFFFFSDRNNFVGEPKISAGAPNGKHGKRNATGLPGIVAKWVVELLVYLVLWRNGW